MPGRFQVKINLSSHRIENVGFLQNWLLDDDVRGALINNWGLTCFYLLIAYLLLLCPPSSNPITLTNVEAFPFFMLICLSCKYNHRILAFLSELHFVWRKKSGRFFLEINELGNLRHAGYLRFWDPYCHCHCQGMVPLQINIARPKENIIVLLWLYYSFVLQTKFEQSLSTLRRTACIPLISARPLWVAERQNYNDVDAWWQCQWLRWP